MGSEGEMAELEKRNLAHRFFVKPATSWINFNNFGFLCSSLFLIFDESGKLEHFLILQSRGNLPGLGRGYNHKTFKTMY